MGQKRSGIKRPCRICKNKENRDMTAESVSVIQETMSMPIMRIGERFTPLRIAEPAAELSMLSSMVKYDQQTPVVVCWIEDGDPDLNIEYNGDHFPDTDEGGSLVIPCDDKPDDHFDFVIGSTARLATLIGKTQRGRTTATLLGLNRPDLRAYRSKLMMKLYVL